MAGLNYISFNQDHSQLAVATTRGLRIYSTDPFELHNTTLDNDISLVEQLFSTSLVATVLTPRLLRIVNTKKNSTICELTFHGMIVAVKMNRKRLVVVLEETIFIYDISNMKMLHSQLTPLNPSGICAMSPNSENNYLALPHYQKTAPTNAQPTHVPRAVSKEAISGDVLLYDLNNLEEVTVITAHQTAVSCLAISNDGKFMASASEKGTIIRIFSIPDGKKLYQFRRGSIPSRIFCMSFNAVSTLLCVSSATETIHIFKLASPEQRQKPLSPPSSPRQSLNHTRERSESPSTSDDPADSTITADGGIDGPAKPRSTNFMSMVRRTSQNVSTSLVSRAAGYLPSSVTEIWEPQRDFAWARVPRGQGGITQKCVVAMGNHSPSVLVATNQGDFFAFSIDLDKGGEGTLIRQHHGIHGVKSSRGCPYSSVSSQSQRLEYSYCDQRLGAVELESKTETAANG